MSDPLLSIAGLSIEYRDGTELLHAVRDLTVTLERGQSLGLVGESGSGKSTLALGLMRYLPRNGRISAGSMCFDGTDLVTLSDRQLQRVRGRRIAMVYQNPSAALNPCLVVGDQIAEVFSTHFQLSRADAYERVVALLGRVQLADPTEAYTRYPHEFSGGQLQRIVIAMALAGEPDLLVLDEPTTGLDVTIEAEIMALIADVQRETGAAVLFISHDITLVAQTCERVAVMYAGQIVESGDTESVLNRPAHGYTRALLNCAIPFGATKSELTLDPIVGQAPRIVAEGGGCSFEPRCAYASAQCGRAPVALTTIAPGRDVRCLHSDEVLADASVRARLSPVPVDAHLADPAGEVLRTGGLRKVYHAGGRDVVAVVDGTIELRRGEVLGIVGESGSGKTTLARMIAGLVDPTAGTIDFAGTDISRPARRRPRAVLAKLQMVFQHPDATLNPQWQVRKLLRRSLVKLTDLRGRELDARLDEITKQVQLSAHHLDRRPAQLSGGQKQRVAIARAFGARPALILCDEPTSSLDVSAQAAILRLLVDLQRTSGTSYIYISHDLATVRYLADHIVVMHLGEIVESGPAVEVFEHPQHPYTRALLSAVRTLGGEQRCRRDPAPAEPPEAARRGSAEDA